MTSTGNRLPLKVIGNPPDGWEPKSMPAGMKRTDCPPRSPSWPCPFVTCRFNTLLVAGSERPGRYRGRIPDAIVMRETSCVLDFCDAHDAGASAKQIGIAMSLTGRRIQQLLARIAEKLRNGGELVAAGVVDGLDVERAASYRSHDVPEPRESAMATKPAALAATLVLTVLVGDRRAEVTVEGDAARAMLAMFRDARTGSVREVHRKLRAGLEGA